MMEDDEENKGGAGEPEGIALDETMRLRRDACLEQARDLRSVAGERGLVLESYIVPEHAAEILDSVDPAPFVPLPIG